MPGARNPVLTARSVIAVFPPDQRPQIAGLEREELYPARKIPNYRPAPPASEQSL